MNEEKKLFSINCSAYVMSVTKIVPKIEESEHKGVYYCVFTPCHAVSQAINDFRNDAATTVNLRDFLSCIKQIRTTMHQLAAGD